MKNRREFLAASGGIVLAGVGAAPAVASTRVARRTGGMPAMAVFQALQGQDFRVRTASRGQATLRLVAVRERVSNQRLEQFSIVLRGSERDALEGGVYRMEHPQSGRFALRLDPSGGDGGTRLYRADFSLLV